MFFPLALLVGGYLFTSTLFADAHSKQRAHAYLTLPISNLERGVVRLLLSTLGYTVAALIAYFLVTLLGAGVSQLIWGTSHGMFVPSVGSWRMVLLYLVTSALFLFGAIYFRRWHAFKVIMALTTPGLGLALLASGLSWLLFGDFAQFGEVFDADLMIAALRLAEAIVVAAKIFLWAIMGPLFWLLKTSNRILATLVVVLALLIVAIVVAGRVIVGPVTRLHDGGGPDVERPLELVRFSAISRSR